MYVALSLKIENYCLYSYRICTKLCHSVSVTASVPAAALVPRSHAERAQIMVDIMSLCYCHSNFIFPDRNSPFRRQLSQAGYVVNACFEPNQIRTRQIHVKFIFSQNTSSLSRTSILVNFFLETLGTMPKTWLLYTIGCRRLVLRVLWV